jgi:hypothetical protein
MAVLLKHSADRCSVFLPNERLKAEIHDRAWASAVVRTLSNMTKQVPSALRSKRLN